MSTFTSKFKSTPTFTFKGWTKTFTPQNDPAKMPSPLHYNPQKVSLKKSPTAKFAKSNRRQWQQIKSKESIPGPGSYQQKSYTTSGFKKTISKAGKTPSKFISTGPSPGQYNGDSLVTKIKSPSFTMQKKTISTQNIISRMNEGKPSPTNYSQPIIKYASTNSISIGRSKRNSYIMNQKHPGPGSYEHQKSFNSSILSESKCKIGRDKRKIDFSIGEMTPGPGSYQKKSFIEVNRLKQKGFSCRGKFNIESPTAKVPGPGQYQTQKFENQRPTNSIKIPKQLRISFTEKAVKTFSNPGPGTFDLEGVDRMKFRSMSVHKFSKSKQNYITQAINSQSSKKLGPGFYNPKQFYIKSSSPKFSINLNQKKGLFEKLEKLPGPSQYDPKTSLIHESKFTHKIQKSERPNIIKHLEKLPGPGLYQSGVIDKGRTFKFSKSKRGSLKEQKSLKQKSMQHQTFQERQQFPNPPKYMSVSQKLKFKEKPLPQKKVIH